MRKRIRSASIVAGCVILIVLGPALMAEQHHAVQMVGAFSKQNLEGWKPEYFVDETRYRFHRRDDSVSVICAHSQKSASGLLRGLEIDLNKTPFLNWSWKIENVLPNRDEKSKEGDDYAARVYVVVDDGPFFWQTKALNYVWAGKAPPGSLWTSPYISDNVKLIAVESGKKRVGTWVLEKRNVARDLKNAFGRTFSEIAAVAIMTDTDNTGSEARACYGDIFFSAG